jgi:hypothetical protein
MSLFEQSKRSDAAIGYQPIYEGSRLLILSFRVQMLAVRLYERLAHQ